MGLIYQKINYVRWKGPSTHDTTKAVEKRIREEAIEKKNQRINRKGPYLVRKQSENTRHY